MEINSRTTASVVTSHYHVNGLNLASADYDVEGTINRRSNATNTCRIAGRFATASYDEDLVSFANGTGVFPLQRVVGGAFTTLGTYTQAMKNGQDLACALQFRGNVIKVLIGVERISVTDTNAIPIAGTAGHAISGQVVFSATGASLTQLRVLAA